MTIRRKLYDLCVHQGLPRLYDVLTEDRPRIWDHEWDSLLILDACRYDVFSEQVPHDMADSLGYRRTRASGTPEYLSRNFPPGEEHHDVVYVSANMFCRELIEKDAVHDLISVWLPEEGWDEDLCTVTPETVTEYAIHAAEKYPHKRLIIHYIQPHTPYIGEDRLGSKTAWRVRAKQLGEEPPSDLGKNPIDMYRDGEVTRERLIQAYRSNLDRALAAVKTATNALDGKTVVTADHGESFGERAFGIPIYGHPNGIYSDTLTKVPWLELPYESRRQIVSEEPQGRETDVDEKTVEDRLKALGYAE